VISARLIMRRSVAFADGAARAGRRHGKWYPPSMTIKARVHKGRFVVEEPTHLPEGTEVELLPLDPGDWLASDDRALLHRALLASQEDVEAGRLIDAEEVLRELQMP